MDTDIPQGRARGRARGKPVTGDDPRYHERRPGDAPPGMPGIQKVLEESKGRGRGRGDSGEAPKHGARSRPSRIATPSGQVGITEGVSGMKISESSSDTGSTGPSDANGSSRKDLTNSPSSGNGDGNGNGHGEQKELVPSSGRGAKRGKAIINTEAHIRTMPESLASKKGTTGRVVKVNTNYFALKKLPNWKLFQYRVDMLPDVDFTKERKYHVRQCTELGNYFFDGTILITTHPLTHPPETPKIFSSRRSSDDQIIQVTVRLVGEVDSSSMQYLQFLNIILRSMFEHLKLEKIGRNFYDPKAAIRDPKLRTHKLELYPGYVTSIRQHENQILLGVEISHKILRTDTVLDMIRTIMGNSRGGDIKGILEKELLGQIIITKYNNITYKICDIDMTMDPSKEFEDKKGNKVKFYEYYLKRWGMKITDLKQPMIVSIPKEKDDKGNVRPPIQLVPELCNMTGLSENQRSNFNLMKDLGEYTRQGPPAKVKGLMHFSTRVTNAPDVKNLLAKWDLEFDTQLQTIDARVLPTEDILGAAGAKTTYQERNADWGNCFRKWKCTSSVELRKWACIYSGYDEKNSKDFCQKLIQACGSMGLKFGEPDMRPISGQALGHYKAELDKVAADTSFKMVMVVIPNNKNPEMYAMIKKKCCIQTPLPSQVMTSKVISNPKSVMSVATKVALQMNCKLGGQLWTVPIPMKKIMVIGFDVYHDSQQKGKSVGALVASINDTLTQYFSATEFHTTNGAQEISSQITSMMSKALDAYKRKNGILPDRVFFYRDGVGDGQIPFVHDVEVKAMKDVIRRFNPDMKLTVIITSKRINTRFMMPGSVPDNPVSGTIIDDGVTLPERYDFFLVSQSVRQGTVNPTSYNVIWDESGLKPDHIQRLSYKLTHLYYNWPGTVRVPAPVQYAHKLAYLVGTSIHASPPADMQEILYYL